MNNVAYGTPFEMEEIVPPAFPDRVIRVTALSKHGETDNGLIQRAVDVCAEQGGGTVIVPEGEWRSGPIHLRSFIHLHFEKDAVVRFSERFDDYLPVVFTRWEGMECYNYSPLIYANGCENIAVTGEGTLIGSGEAWWHWKQLQQEAANRLCYAESDGIPVQERVYGTEQDALRPSFVQPINCKNVLIEGISIQNGPQWTIHPQGPCCKHRAQHGWT
jgi:polygalacturonase